MVSNWKFKMPSDDDSLLISWAVFWWFCCCKKANERSWSKFCERVLPSSESRIFAGFGRIFTPRAIVVKTVNSFKPSKYCWLCWCIQRNSRRRKTFCALHHHRILPRRRFARLVVGQNYWLGMEASNQDGVTSSSRNTSSPRAQFYSQRYQIIGN